MDYPPTLVASTHTGRSSIGGAQLESNTQTNIHQYVIYNITIYIYIFIYVKPLRNRKTQRWVNPRNRTSTSYWTPPDLYQTCTTCADLRRPRPGLQFHVDAAKVGATTTASSAPSGGGPAADLGRAWRMRMAMGGPPLLGTWGGWDSGSKVMIGS